MKKMILELEEDQHGELVKIKKEKGHILQWQVQQAVNDWIKKHKES